MINISPENKKKLCYGLGVTIVAFIIALGVSLITESVRNENNKQENTISFSGHGEVKAVPDIATVDFTIRKSAKTVKEAQDGVAEVEKKVLDLLKTSKIDDKDIKTTNASFNPKYEYQYGKVICNQYGCPPNPGKNVIVGYEAYESINLKIRNTDDTGKIIEGLGALGVSELNGPNFTVDNEDGLKVEARKKAIDDAKEKAETLAKDLGVHLGKITSFNENGNYPVPMYAKNMMADGVSASGTPAQLPKGENLISSDVTITYELK